MDGLQQNALFIFTQDWSKLKEIKLHLKGTDFQLKVWEALLKIPMGGLTTYGDFASGIPTHTDIFWSNIRRSREQNKFICFAEAQQYM